MSLHQQRFKVERLQIPDAPQQRPVCPPGVLDVNELTERKNVQRQNVRYPLHFENARRSRKSFVYQGTPNSNWTIYLHAHQKDSVSKFRLCCNTSNFDLLHNKHKLTFKNVFHLHCVVRGESHPLKTKTSMDNMFQTGAQTIQEC